MKDASIERLQQLQALAETDNIYQVWARSYEDCRESFTQFAATQPEEIRNFLWGYAQSAELAQQRLVNLACLHMIFPEEGSPL